MTSHATPASASDALTGSISPFWATPGSVKIVAYFTCSRAAYRPTSREHWLPKTTSRGQLNNVVDCVMATSLFHWYGWCGTGYSAKGSTDRALGWENSRGAVAPNHAIATRSPSNDAAPNSQNPPTPHRGWRDAVTASTSRR